MVELTGWVIGLILVTKGACAILMLWFAVDAFRTPPATVCHVVAMCIALFLGVLCIEFMWYDVKHLVLHWEQPDRFVARVRDFVNR